MHSSHRMEEAPPLETYRRRVCAGCGGREDTRLAEPAGTVTDLKLEEPCGAEGNAAIAVPEGKGLMGYHQPGTVGWPFRIEEDGRVLVVVIPGEQALNNEEAA